VAADLLAMQLPLAGLFWHKLRRFKDHIGNGPQADEVFFKELLQLTKQLAPGIDAMDLGRGEPPQLTLRPGRPLHLMTCSIETP
jgi:hypothetical protein